jgi:2-polyprenyl-3-methyl-5-hydroxy-6-metoxy-1,4-benzoquinol methylase
MSGSEFHESLWVAVPEGLAPIDFERRLAFLLAHVAPGQRVLDVGCGEGWFATELIRAGAEATGIDVAEEPLRRGRRRDPRLDLRRIEADRPWSLPDAGFDVVWAGEVIEHVLDTALWLSETRRVLAPGGTLLLSTPDHGPLRLLALAARPAAFDAHFDPRSDHVRFYTRRTLTALLDAFRFDVAGVRAVGGWPGARHTLLAQARRLRF